ncbi:hypothetical protein VT84_18070 [Gemmata sp. SH-PL17]|uniref:DUF6134 family protein n=1 Tax=Gemmata sp. SH-PL17 TaxID=1630693 RepID=UPI00078BBF7B|nr:DUF6134 family protein [Gemmata sp. SH-PL17]AMV26310.1 hypothetical protein VT84_18070 [Gemmata sp. SH-PL17]
MVRVFNLKAGAGLAVAVASWLLWRALAPRPAVLAVGSVGFAGVPLAGADEVRTFTVLVDGKPGGSCAIATATAADGTETVAVTTDVQVKAGLFSYTYHLNSVEVWRKGQLVSLEAKSNDDGKKRAVKAVANEQGLVVTVDKDTRKAAGTVLTATGVRVPAADKVRDAVLFDAEDGSETAVRVEPLGACRVPLNGKTIEGARYKLTGKDVAAEWWFDANGRVIRQEMKWDGHKVVLELNGVK